MVLEPWVILEIRIGLDLGRVQRGPHGKEKKSKCLVRERISRSLLKLWKKGNAHFSHPAFNQRKTFFTFFSTKLTLPLGKEKIAFISETLTTLPFSLSRIQTWPLGFRPLIAVFSRIQCALSSQSLCSLGNRSRFSSLAVFSLSRYYILDNNKVKNLDLSRYLVSLYLSDSHGCDFQKTTIFLSTNKFFDQVRTLSPCKPNPNSLIQKIYKF